MVPRVKSHELENMLLARFFWERDSVIVYLFFFYVSLGGVEGVWGVGIEIKSLAWVEQGHTWGEG